METRLIDWLIDWRLFLSGAHHEERATPILSLWHSIFKTRPFLGFFSREIDQFRSVWARIGKEKKWQFFFLIFLWNDDVS